MTKPSKRDYDIRNKVIDTLKRHANVHQAESWVGMDCNHVDEILSLLSDCATDIVGAVEGVERNDCDDKTCGYCDMYHSRVNAARSTAEKYIIPKT